jgi:hypothetical protein
MTRKDELLERARQYVQRHGLTVTEELGAGVHGTVFVVESQTETGIDKARAAVKIHVHQADYCRERDVYLRLREHGIVRISKCEVPQLLRYDDQLWAIEMTVVTRPFVLDFAGAYLDRAPDFSEEVLDEWRAEKQEQFGGRWPEVQAILRFLEGLGIHLIDVTPNNISLGL